jgi:hypothetical protein
VFIYLIFLVVSSILHQKRDDTVWGAQVRSYPWFRHFYCHKLGSSPELLPPPQHAPAPISAPQPRRPIHLLSHSALSSLSKAERAPHRQSGLVEPSVPQSTMQRSMPAMPGYAVPTFYPSHIQAALEPAVERVDPSGVAISFSQHTPSQQHLRSSLADGSEPPPLLNWPRADIMSNSSPRRMAARKQTPASALPSIVERPRDTREGRPLNLPSSSRQVLSDRPHERV